MYLDAGDLSMNFFSTLGESFLCGLVTAMKKRPLHQSLFFCCKQESFIFKRCSLAQTELLFVKQKDFQESFPFSRKRFLFNFSSLMIFKQ